MIYELRVEVAGLRHECECLRRSAASGRANEAALVHGPDVVAP